MLNAIGFTIFIVIVTALAVLVFLLPIKKHLIEPLKPNNKNHFESGVNPSPDVASQWIFRHFPMIFVYIILYLWALLILLWVVNFGSIFGKSFLSYQFLVFNSILLVGYFFFLFSKINKKVMK